MSTVRVDYILRGESLSVTIPVTQIQSQLALLSGRRAQIQQLVVSAFIDQRSLDNLRECAKPKRLNLTLSHMGV